MGDPSKDTKSSRDLLIPWSEALHRPLSPPPLVSMSGTPRMGSLLGRTRKSSWSTWRRCVVLVTCYVAL